MKSRIHVLPFNLFSLFSYCFSNIKSPGRELFITIKRLSLYSLLSISLAACSDDYNSNTFDKFRTGQMKVSAFEANNGKIGAFAVTPLLAQASNHLGLAYTDAESSIKGFAEFSEFRTGGNNTTQIKAGPHVFAAANANGTMTGNFASVTYKNTGTAPAVLMIEAHEHDGTSQGFSYVKLDPGDTFVYQHNAPPAVVVVAVIGGVAVVITVIVVVVDLVDIAAADIANAIVPGIRCVFVKNNILPNYCSGQRCPAPTTCKAATTKAYNWSGTEPATCGCI